MAAASCCTKGMQLRATDVAGTERIHEAVWDGTGGSGLSSTTLYAIIGAVAAVVLIIIIIVVIVVCRNKYSAVSQNP